MEKTEREMRREKLRKLLEKKAFVRGEKTPYFNRSRGRLDTNGWLFDVKNILLEPDAIEDIVALFWDTFENDHIQIGSIETAGIALAAMLTTAGVQSGKKTSGFYIRKSRKKDGLMKMVEGEIKDNQIVLVDDIINSGSSFLRQIEVIESLGKKVESIWTIIRFHDVEYYSAFQERGIKIYSLFELNDFKDLGTRNLSPTKPAELKKAWEGLWKFSAGSPSLFYVVPKSDPVIDSERLYVGSDDGVMWALSQEDGSVTWSFKIGFHSSGKGIFSSPALYKGTVFFGGYDGNFYALDAATGKKKWMYMEADWIGSSPAVAPDLGLVFVGLEFGLWKKRGGIVALDITTGKKVWWNTEMPCYTHSSPLYIAKHQQVIIGSNDGGVRLFDAKTGRLVWTHANHELTEAELNSGFSPYDIKESFAYDEKRDLIIFGNMHGDVFFIDRVNAKTRGSFKAEFGFFSTPVIYENIAMISNLDKYLYAIDLDTFKVKWKWEAGARIFATPTIIGSSVYVGSNSGTLTELNPENGVERSRYLLTERITNRVVHNPTTGRFFVPTFANEIYCLKKLT